MRPESPYESWKRWRSAGDIPAGFADRVMASVAREPQLPPQSQHRRWTWVGVEWSLAALLASRAGKVGVCTLGCLACAFRILSLVALFLPR